MMSAFRAPNRGARFLALLTLLALLAAPAATLRAQANPPLPTMADLQAMYDQNAYRVCLQQIYRVINLRADLAKPYDRPTLLLLRGQCLLAQRDRNGALQAYKAAEDAATTSDLKLQARAVRVLLVACPALVYQPQDRSAAPRDPIDIVAETTRKKAMGVAFADRYDAAATAVAGLQSATTLVALQAVVPQLLDLAALEKIATGTMERSLPLARSIGERARALITAELKTISTRDNNLRQLASVVVTNNAVQTTAANGTKWWDGIERRGLNPDDRNVLRRDIEYLTRIADTLQDAAALSQLYNGNADRWTAIRATADQALKLAATTLDSD